MRASINSIWETVGHIGEICWTTACMTQNPVKITPCRSQSAMNIPGWSPYTSKQAHPTDIQMAIPRSSWCRMSAAVRMRLSRAGRDMEEMQVSPSASQVIDSNRDERSFSGILSRIHHANSPTAAMSEIARSGCQVSQCHIHQDSLAVGENPQAYEIEAAPHTPKYPRKNGNCVTLFARRLAMVAMTAAM